MLKWVQARGSQDPSCRWHPDWVWANLEGPGIFWAGGVLASYLEVKWWGPGLFWDALHLCHLGRSAVVNTNHGCSSVVSPGATFTDTVLVWARGLAEVVGWLWCPEPALVCALKVDWEDKQWCSPAPPKQRIPAAPTLLGRVLGLDLSYSSYPLKPHCFFCIPGQTDLLMVIQYYPSPPWFSVRGLAVPFLTVSLTFLYVVYLLLCRRCSVSPVLFFRRKCFINRCRFGMSMEEVSSGSSCMATLDWNLLFILIVLVSYGLVWFS